MRGRKWPVASAQPRIVELLRILGRGTPEERAQADAERIALLTEWDSRENLTNLRKRLGVNAGKRRTQITVSQETALARRIMAAALNGRDVHTFAAAADATGGDEKQLERAWRSWGGSQIVPMLRAIAGSSTQFAGRAKAALRLVPPTTTRSSRLAIRKKRA